MQQTAQVPHLRRTCAARYTCITCAACAGPAPHLRRPAPVPAPPCEKYLRRLRRVPIRHPGGAGTADGVFSNQKAPPQCQQGIARQAQLSHKSPRVRPSQIRPDLHPPRAPRRPLGLRRPAGRRPRSHPSPSHGLLALRHRPRHPRRTRRSRLVITAQPRYLASA